MSMLDTLFGWIPAESLGQQWLAEDLQLVNWGGYDGHHTVRFSPTATLLCGGSGSGKSTLMDAYIALMMPHTTPFNGASNGGVQGRPRGAEQRNILSYARGKLDESRTEDGTRLNVLRGDGCDTWTAVAMTWVDHGRDDLRFTAVRAWYLPASARLLEDTVRVRATSEGPLDLRALEPAAAQRFADSALRAAGLVPIATDREFSAKLHATLGIGAAGAGAKAMSLLARIQSGQQITTVDELYKRMVLEEPETLATADAVVQHFDELADTRRRMTTARQQVAALALLRTSRARIEAAADRLRLIDQAGRLEDPDSPAALWRATRRLGLLRTVESELQGRRRSAADAVREKESLADAADAEHDGLVDVLRASGGDRMDTALREIREIDRRLAEVRAHRARLDEALGVLGETAGSATAFARAAEHASQALADEGARGSALDAFAAARAGRDAAERALRALTEEQRAAEGRQGNIPSDLHAARELLARAVGLSSEDLPFVGELIEVRTEFEPWREAFNLALGGFATTLLLDVSRLGEFRAAIDGLRLPGVRVRYEGVPTGQPRGHHPDDRTLPARLEYRPTPFTGWLEERLERRFPYVCVENARELGRHTMALTMTGQISQGDRGAHGGHGRANVLGFSNRRRLAELSGQISAAETRLVEARRAEGAATAALDAVDARRDAHRVIAGLTWEQVDVEGLLSTRESWQTILDQVTVGNPEIARLRERIAAAKQKAARLREEIGRAKEEQERLNEQWTGTVDAVDESQTLVDRAEDAGRALTAEQAAYLDERFEVADSTRSRSVTASAELLRFDTAVGAAAQRLASDRAAAQETLAEQRDELARILQGFLDRWPNPNLMADPDRSVGDFERILDELESSGLAELETEWRDALLTLSGNDLTNLASTLARSLREIRDRIDPINAIMEDLPFYDDAHRLQITIRENQSAVRARVRKELRDVRSLIDHADTEADREAAYGRMERLIARIRRSSPEFADLVDVRTHVHVSAERVRADTHEHVALYDHIGEKSGGESQELIAFIVGAALRYQLGDAGAERPRYAPVFLDEALIKADAHFTKRAIGAWRGLGFQLVIGAPNDKYSAIEPHVDVEYDILKDTHGRSWAKPKVALP